MKYEEILGRSFSRHDQKRFRFGAFVACFLVIWCVFTLVNPYLALLTLDDEVEKTTLMCDTSNRRYDICEMKGDIRIQGNRSSIFVFGSHIGNTSWTIKPYARKGDESAMQGVTSFTLKPIQTKPEPDSKLKCSITHSVPAIVFSVGGYARNNFHSFTDVIIPLYQASVELKRQVKFLVTNNGNSSGWTAKFHQILDNLSAYEIIDIDSENEVHCFPSVTLGLRKDELHVESMKGFTRFLRNVYSLDRSSLSSSSSSSSSSSPVITKKPRLLIISRLKTRAFTNIQDVVRAAQDSGFEVVVAEMNGNLTMISRLVNSCDAMMGVHGAGLTNVVFLPENGLLIQVVPWGNMDWLANTYFREPSKAMGLKYLEYKISEDESSLIEQYPVNDQVLVDPGSIQDKGWDVYRSIYLDKQNVTLNVTRFKETLTRAYEVLH